MGIITYINNQKNKFRQAQSQKRAIQFDMKKDERKKLEKEMEMIRALEQEKQTVTQLKKEKFQSTIAGKIAGNIQKKMRENKKNNVFVQRVQLDNPFTPKK